MGQNIGIFIDYDNVYVTLEKYYETAAKNSLKTDVIDIIKDKFKGDNKLTFKAFADFQKINHCITKLQKSQIELRHIYSNSKGRKNASDIAMAIDIIKSIYSKNMIEKYILVSSDSDMLPIINELQYFAKETFVIYSKYGSVDNYEDYIGSFKKEGLVYNDVDEVLKYLLQNRYLVEFYSATDANRDFAKICINEPLISSKGITLTDSIAYF